MALSRRRKILLSLPLILPALLLLAWFGFTRHVPWKVPPQHQPPPSWRVPVQPGHGLTLRSLGVSGFELTDGTTTVLMDPTPTRPNPLELITGALVVGSQNTINLALSRGVPKEKTRVVHSGDQLTVGTFTIDVRGSQHTDLIVAQPMSGVISQSAGELWFWQYALDETLAFRLEAAGTTVWFHPTSTYQPGELGGLPAKTLIVGVTGEKQTRAKVEGLLGESKALRILPTHYDNFFQPFDRGLALMPGLDLDPPRQLFLAVDPKLEWGVLDLGEAIALPPD